MSCEKIIKALLVSVLFGTLPAGATIVDVIAEVSADIDPCIGVARYTGEHTVAFQSISSAHVGLSYTIKGELIRCSWLPLAISTSVFSRTIGSFPVPTLVIHGDVRCFGGIEVRAKTEFGILTVPESIVTAETDCLETACSAPHPGPY